MGPQKHRASEIEPLVYVCCTQGAKFGVIPRLPLPQRLKSEPMPCGGHHRTVLATAEIGTAWKGTR